MSIIGIEFLSNDLSLWESSSSLTFPPFFFFFFCYTRLTSNLSFNSSNCITMRTTSNGCQMNWEVGTRTLRGQLRREKEWRSAFEERRRNLDSWPESWLPLRRTQEKRWVFLRNDGKTMDVTLRQNRYACKWNRRERSFFFRTWTTWKYIQEVISKLIFTTWTVVDFFFLTLFIILQEVELNKKKPQFIKAKENTSHMNKKLENAK